MKASMRGRGPSSRMTPFPKRLLPLAAVLAACAVTVVNAYETEFGLNANTEADKDDIIKVMKARIKELTAESENLSQTESTKEKDHFDYHEKGSSLEKEDTSRTDAVIIDNIEQSDAFTSKEDVGITNDPYKEDLQEDNSGLEQKSFGEELSSQGLNAEQSHQKDQIGMDLKGEAAKRGESWDVYEYLEKKGDSFGDISINGTQNSSSGLIATKRTEMTDAIEENDGVLISLADVFQNEKVTIESSLDPVKIDSVESRYEEDSPKESLLENQQSLYETDEDSKKKSEQSQVSVDPNAHKSQLGSQLEDTSQPVVTVKSKREDIISKIKALENELSALGGDSEGGEEISLKYHVDGQAELSMNGDVDHKIELPLKDDVDHKTELSLKDDVDRINELSLIDNLSQAINSSGNYEREEKKKPSLSEGADGLDDDSIEAYEARLAGKGGDIQDEIDITLISHRDSIDDIVNERPILEKSRSDGFQTTDELEVRDTPAKVVSKEMDSLFEGDTEQSMDTELKDSQDQEMRSQNREEALTDSRHFEDDNDVLLLADTNSKETSSNTSDDGDAEKEKAVIIVETDDLISEIGSTNNDNSELDSLGKHGEDSELEFYSSSKIGTEDDAVQSKKDAEGVIVNSENYGDVLYSDSREVEVDTDAIAVNNNVSDIEAMALNDDYGSKIGESNHNAIDTARIDDSEQGQDVEERSDKMSVVKDEVVIAPIGIGISDFKIADKEVDAQEKAFTEDKDAFSSSNISPAAIGTAMTKTILDDSTSSDGKSVTRSFIGIIPILFAVISTCVVVAILVRRHMKNNAGENSPMVKDLINFTKAVMQLSPITSTVEGKNLMSKKNDIESAHKGLNDEDENAHYTQLSGQVLPKPSLKLGAKRLNLKSAKQLTKPSRSASSSPAAEGPSGFSKLETKPKPEEKKKDKEEWDSWEDTQDLSDDNWN